MRGYRTCRNPVCPCSNPQPVDDFYPKKHICKVCHKARVSAYKKAHRPDPVPVDETPSRGRYSGDRRNEWDEDILLPLCSECLLPDCCRPEGAYRSNNYRNKRFEGCLVWAGEVARLKKDGVTEAIRIIKGNIP